MGHPIHKHMSSGQRYDDKQAYNKDLSDSARLHYLENEEHDKGMSRNASPLNDFKGGYHKVEHAKGEAHKGTSRKSSPVNNVTYGDKSGPTGYIGEEKKDLMKYNAVDDKAGMSRYKSDAQRKAVHASKADGGMSRQKYGGNKGDERRSAKKDYDGMSRYGGNKGDIKRSAKKDY